MPQITSEEIIEFVRQQGDLQLITLVQKSPFVARVAGDGLEYVLPATEMPRPEGKQVLTRFCEEYNLTNSMHPSDYDFTRNASYTLAVIHAYLNQ